jgi:hypothetical protein
MILCNVYAGVGSLSASVVLVDVSSVQVFRALVAELVCCCIDLLYLFLCVL